MTLRIYLRCKLCEADVPAYGVHICADDAVTVTALRDAERAVVDAAVAHQDATIAYNDLRHAGRSAHDLLVVQADLLIQQRLFALDDAVTALRTLETPNQPPTQPQLGGVT